MNYISQQEIKKDINQVETLTPDEEFIKQYREDLKRTGFNAYDPFSDMSSGSRDDKYLGVIEIPKIDFASPIYLGVSEDILHNAIGLLPKTSLPYGGIGENSVLTGHRGTRDLDLFKHLDKLEMNDSIFIRNGKETMLYKVSEIRTLEPNDGDLIVREKDKDLITLITCTPIYINSHRLVLTAERQPYSEAVASEIIKSETLTFWQKIAKLGYRGAVIAILLLLILFQFIKFIRRKMKRVKENNTSVSSTVHADSGTTGSSS